jgi:hypothetical protein
VTLESTPTEDLLKELSLRFSVFLIAGLSFPEDSPELESPTISYYGSLIGSIGLCEALRISLKRDLEDAIMANEDGEDAND